MDRRIFLTTASATAGVGLAGCSGMLGDGNDSSGDAETTEDGGQGDDAGGVTAWSSWVPREAFAEDSSADIVTVDVQGARENFPEQEYQELSIPDLAEALNIPEQEFDTITILSRDFGPEPGVIRGSFSEQDVLSELTDGSSETEEYLGFTIVDDQFGVGDGALLLGEEFRQLIRAQSGEIPSVADSEDWQDLFADMGEWDFFIGTGGYYDDSGFEYDLRASAVNIKAVGDGSALFEAVFLFRDAETAETAFDESESSLREEAQSEENMTYVDATRTERVITLQFETSSLADVLSDTDNTF